MSTAAGSVESAPAPISVRRELLAHSIVFVLGFTLVFVLAGASASALGALFKEHQVLIARVIGVVIILLGLNMMGLFRIPFLAMDKRLHFAHTSTSYPATLVAGIGFAAGWSPCIGPVLAAVIALAGSTSSVGLGVAYLLVYSLGLGIPFILTGLALNYVLPVLKRFRRYLHAIEIVAGTIVIGMGLILVTNSFLRFTGFLYKEFPALANVGTGPDLGGGALTFGAVFLAGVVSFISPCVLPLVPAYISLLTGRRLETLVDAYEVRPASA
ncbi:MAG TPA: cytochrome c biogenesis protein CcdA [Candidatus Eremiobacteraceae bacterium]|nr:cytochrome c biogenesis protein CcdA [Candidatus Eremiobacteraceae bacterium]